MFPVANFRGNWSFATNTGSIQLALAGGGGQQLGPLSADQFAAVMALLRSGDQLFFDPVAKNLFSRE
jgi:hypothetical protein